MEPDKEKEIAYIQIPTGELSKLLGHGDGNAALLYLHIQLTGGYSVNRAVRELKCTQRELLSAAETLRSLGMLPAPTDDSEPPEYSASEIAERAKNDPDFAAILAEAENAFGRTLGQYDMKLLYDIYDHWGLQADVIMVLINHCVEQYQGKAGPGRKPTMRYVEREARIWAQMKIYTLDAAEERIRQVRERQSVLGQVKETLQIYGRELTSGEENYIDSWLGMGFGLDVLSVAYQRTVMSTGRLVWKYMDKILHSWDDKKLYTPKEIEAGDSWSGKSRKSVRRPAQSGDDKKKVEAMRQMQAYMRREKEKRNGV